MLVDRRRREFAIRASATREGSTSDDRVRQLRWLTRSGGSVSWGGRLRTPKSLSHAPRRRGFIAEDLIFRASWLCLGDSQHERGPITAMIKAWERMTAPPHQQS